MNFGQKQDEHGRPYELVLVEHWNHRIDAAGRTTCSLRRRDLPISEKHFCFELLNHHWIGARDPGLPPLICDSVACPCSLTPDMAYAKVAEETTLIFNQPLGEDTQT